MKDSHSVTSCEAAAVEEGESLASSTLLRVMSDEVTWKDFTFHSSVLRTG